MSQPRVGGSSREVEEAAVEEASRRRRRQAAACGFEVLHRIRDSGDERQRDTLWLPAERADTADDRADCCADASFELTAERADAAFAGVFADLADAPPERADAGFTDAAERADTAFADAAERADAGFAAAPTERADPGFPDADRADAVP